MLIYIHVPFCRHRCAYCAFHAEAIGRESNPLHKVLLESYAKTLSAEISLWAARLGKASVQTIFFGGGTPSLLSPSVIASVLEKLRASFVVEPGAEITLEANPESLRGSHAPEGYRQAGITRLSLGVQSFDDAMLHMLGRVHKACDSFAAVHNARAAGFANVGLDVMWALPRQSIRHWLQTLRRLVELAPDHISTYGLTLEPGTPFERAYREGRFTLPNEHEQRVMFLEGAAFLEKHGYLQYEISNFAKMGFQCRHNLGYWEGADYLGLGPSATSTLGSVRWTNPASQTAWEEAVAKGQVGGAEERLSPLIRVLETIMLRLRTNRGLPLERYKALTGHDFLVDHSKMVQALHENGLIRIRNNCLRLTPSGMLVSNAILSNLFEQTKRVLEVALPNAAAKAAVDKAGRSE